MLRGCGGCRRAATARARRRARPGRDPRRGRDRGRAARGPLSASATRSATPHRWRDVFQTTLLLLRELIAQAVLALALFRRELLPEVLILEDLADLDLALL